MIPINKVKLATPLTVLVAVGCNTQSKPVEWEHGWKTKHVIGTRIRNPAIGMNLKIEFPFNPYDYDRTAIKDLLEKHHCEPLEMGGYHGAPIYVICDGMKTKEDANSKLQELLPPLERLATSFELTNGVEI